MCTRSRKRQLESRVNLWRTIWSGPASRTRFTSPSCLVAAVTLGLRSAPGSLARATMAHLGLAIWTWTSRMYGSWGASTVVTLKGEFSLSDLSEPRIEPEVIFGLSQTPERGMKPFDLLGCVGWIAHGFEIVQSIFPGWVFTPADTVAAYGLHRPILIGPPCWQKETG